MTDNACWIVDFEANETDPMIAKVECTLVAGSEVDPKVYLLQLLQDLVCSTGFNMTVTETEEGAREEVTKRQKVIDADG